MNEPGDKNTAFVRPGIPDRCWSIAIRVSLGAVGDSMPGAVEHEVVAEGSTQRPLRTLFADLAEGRAAALEGLYDALAGDVYGLALWRTASPEDAADVLQEVFVRVAQAGPRLSRVRDPRAYVLRIAHRAAIDVHRRRRRRAEEPLEDVHLVEKSSGANELALDAQQRWPGWGAPRDEQGRETLQCVWWKREFDRDFAPGIDRPAPLQRLSAAEGEGEEEEGLR